VRRGEGKREKREGGKREKRWEDEKANEQHTGNFDCFFRTEWECLFF
jgi:hypothetical protein